MRLLQEASNTQSLRLRQPLLWFFYGPNFSAQYMEKQQQPVLPLIVSGVTVHPATLTRNLEKSRGAFS